MWEPQPPGTRRVCPGPYRDCFNFTLIFCIVSVFFCYCTVCSLQQCPWHAVTVQCSLQQCPWHAVTVQCVRSSNALDMLSLYIVFAPAMPLTCCHCTLCSLQQCPWHAVTVQCVRSSNALDVLSLYSVFAPAMPLTCCHCTVCSVQQCPWHTVIMGWEP